MDNSTTVGWTSEPNGRGTFGILKSCVLTLGLCVYTALHLNISRSDATRFSKYLTKAKWVLLGVFAPEFVVFVAWSQSEHAKRLSTDLNSIFADQEAKDPKNKRRYEWTQMHGFYAVMGGFAIDTDVPGEDPYIPDSPKLAANDLLILVAAKKGLLPDISKEYIRDKSKADHLAKVLVIAQASWLILQVIMRWASKLPVTALELNTLAHSICALLVYSLWWDKPLDIQDPTLLTGAYFPPLVALSWEAADVRTYQKFEYETDHRKHLPKALGYESVVDYDVRRTNVQSQGWQAVPAWEGIASGPWSNALVGALNKTYSRNPVGFPFLEIRNGKAHKRVLLLQANREFWSEPATGREEVVVGVLEMTRAGMPLEENPGNAKNHHALQRWRLISTIRDEYTETLQFIKASIIHFNIDAGTAFPPKVVGLEYGSKEALVIHAKTNMDFWALDSGGDMKAILAFILFCLCALAYGGVHASAWNDYFPTSVERLLWRISAIIVAVLGILGMLIVVGFQFGEYIQDNMRKMRMYKNHEILLDKHSIWYNSAQVLPESLKSFISTIMDIFDILINSPDRWRDSVLEAMMAAVYWLIVIIFLAAIVLYCLCRSFLVIEAFISLRRLPSSAYSTPSWPQYLPHL